MRRKTTLRAPILFAFATAMALLACLEEEGDPLPNPEALFAERAGFSVAISGDVILSGARWSDAVTDEAGKVLVYQRNAGTWDFEQSLFSATPYTGGLFGESVDIDGDRAMVSAFGEPNLELFYISGAVHFFEKQGSTWTEVANFLPDSQILAEGFGKTVSISGDWAVVGAPFESFYGDVMPGTVFVYRRLPAGAWAFSSAIILPNGSNGDQFGAGVSLHGDVLLVGASHDDEAGLDAGAAYLFQRQGNQWLKLAKVLAFDAQPGDHFGNAVSLSGEVFVVGAESNNQNGLDAGAAYVFDYDNANTAWDFSAKLNGFDSEDEFGNAVSVDGERIIVGAWLAAGNWNTTGAAYAYRRSDSGLWGIVRKFLASDGGNGDGFGAAVDISADCAAIGAPNWDGPQGNYVGATYAFCDIPPLEDPGLGVDMAIICCETPPDPAGPVTFGLRYLPTGSRPVPIERWVELTRPDGRVQTVLERRLIEPLPDTPLDERGQVLLGRDAPRGTYRLHAYRMDAIGTVQRATGAFVR